MSVYPHDLQDRTPAVFFMGVVTALSLVTCIGAVIREALIAILPKNTLKKGAALIFILIKGWMFFGK